MTQHQAVIQTLEKLGGKATLGLLNQEVLKIKECEWKTKTPFASIRRIVQERPEIFKIRPGLWALKSLEGMQGFIAETPENKNSEAVKEENHAFYQGIITELGNLKQLATFLPNQDKNRKYFDKKLDDLRTLKEIPPFSYDFLVQRARTIDCIWFNERTMPDSFFEVEHSTDIQNSLVKYADLQDFNVKMYVVADEARKKEFDTKINYIALKSIQKRVQFISYDELMKHHELAFKQVLSL
jgi:hypothetical protein